MIRNRPQKIITTPNNRSTSPVKSPTKRSKRSFAPPSPRIVFENQEEISSTVAYFLFALCLILVLIIVSLFLLDTTTVYYLELISISPVIISIFTFWNWLGLKYFCQNAWKSCTDQYKIWSIYKINQTWYLVEIYHHQLSSKNSIPPF